VVAPDEAAPSVLTRVPVRCCAAAEKYLAAAAAAESPEERMLGVVTWLLACKRQPPYFKKPARWIVGCDTSCV